VDTSVSKEYDAFVFKGANTWCYNQEEHNLTISGHENIFKVVYLTDRLCGLEVKNSWLQNGDVFCFL
jgi:hypothetical protein